MCLDLELLLIGFNVSLTRLGSGSLVLLVARSLAKQEVSWFKSSTFDVSGPLLDDTCSSECNLVLGLGIEN